MTETSIYLYTSYYLLVKPNVWERNVYNVKRIILISWYFKPHFVKRKQNTEACPGLINCHWCIYASWNYRPSADSCYLMFGLARSYGNIILISYVLGEVCSVAHVYICICKFVIRLCLFTNPTSKYEDL